ncbi:MAG: hypothetical protein Q9191_006678 [Dirinaria sp. TL-2023a]
MSSLLKSVLFLGVSTLALASFIPCGSQVALEAVAAAGGAVVPSGFWQIYQQDKQRSTNLFPSSPNGTALFFVSQGDNAANKFDLIVSFTNIPNGPGPYSIEFLYSNPARAGYGSDGNDVINTFAITGALPTNNVGNIVQPFPTWDNVDKLRGSLIGTFHLPRGDEDPTHIHRIFINQVTWNSTISLRFSITTDSSNSGFVRWLQNNDNVGFVPGVRINYGG